MLSEEISICHILDLLPKTVCNPVLWFRFPCTCNSQQKNLIFLHTDLCMDVLANHTVWSCLAMNSVIRGEFHIASFLKDLCMEKSHRRNVFPKYFFEVEIQEYVQGKTNMWLLNVCLFMSFSSLMETVKDFPSIFFFLAEVLFKWVLQNNEKYMEGISAQTFH